MKELKSPIVLLVLVVVIAAFSAPFGTPALAAFAKDFLPAMATLVAAYAGVRYGSTLKQQTTTREQRIQKIGAGARALFTIWRQLNTIAQIQEDVIAKYRNYSPAPLAMPPITVHIDDTIRLDIDSLAFLLDHGKSDLLANLCIAETRFVHAVDAIRRRSALHANEVQLKLENMIPESRNLTPEELRGILGIRLFSLLVNQTHEVIAKTDDAVETLEVVSLDLHAALKAIFPEGKFPLPSPIEEETAKSVKTPRPTGLL
ncbi:MAG: hypothetical protein HY081_09155 [Gammaproteobacteria bacterium]|nr:hypothetical protein [Gammaproteobacteria bacterium]